MSARTTSGASRPFPDPERSAATRRGVEGPLEQPPSVPGTYHVYILTNKIHTVRYIGVTGFLAGRIYQHRKKLIEGFTKRYQVSKLIDIETFADQKTAEKCEQQLKDWRRSKKIALIERMNPQWLDLFRPILNDPDFNPHLVGGNASKGCSRDPSTARAGARSTQDSV